MCGMTDPRILGFKRCITATAEVRLGYIGLGVGLVGVAGHNMRHYIYIYGV